MNAGRIEQIGEPLDVYRRPATSFVARFIGTTNLLPVTRGNDGVLRVAGREFALSGDEVSGNIVIFGATGRRPPLAGRPASAQRAPGDIVVFVRDLGEMFECYVDCGLENNVVVAGSPRERVQVQQGERVAVSFPAEACVVVGGGDHA